MTSFGSSSTKLCILAFLITISGHKLAFSQKQATNIFKTNRHLSDYKLIPTTLIWVTSPTIVTIAQCLVSNMECNS